MKEGDFCFLSDGYFKAFKDEKLMKNKEVINGVKHHRPCFFAIKDKNNANIYWLVPISTKIEKYKSIYDDKVEKHGKCQTICFGEVMGVKSAFLIQNMCPATKRYIDEIFVDKNSNLNVAVDKITQMNVIKNAREVLKRIKYSPNLIFPNVNNIYKGLLAELEASQKLSAPAQAPPPRRR